MMRALRTPLFAAALLLLACGGHTAPGSGDNACADLQACCNTGTFPANGQAACNALTQADDSTACAQGLGGYVGAGICAGSGGPSSASLDGTYECALTATVTVQGVTQHETTVVALTVAGSGNDLTVAADADGGSCPIHLTASGNTATITPAQVCAEGGTTTTVTGGMFTVSGSTATFTLSVTVGGVSSGTAVESGTCTKT